jgi:predicted acylesterase/phospholipase RssA
MAMAVRDAALATTAAPIFLPPHALDKRLYVDGGLAANSPEGIAASHAAHRLGWPRETLHLLVVGATQAPARVPGHLIGAQWGVSRWLSRRRLLAIAMRAQMTLARDLAEAILGQARISIIDAELTGEEEKLVGLDKADLRAAGALRTLASERYAEFRALASNPIDRLMAHGADPRGV